MMMDVSPAQRRQKMRRTTADRPRTRKKMDKIPAIRSPVAQHCVVGLRRQAC
jgi:hypothetical protein